ncbi:heterokaryon incompatibility protein-domain-containing protein [Hyaloscypha finlandica]|nr:heterokaryon incompatibility protein-domain-containing protein [Hyaloscypha finlandica]
MHTTCQVKGTVLSRRVIDIGWKGAKKFLPRVHEAVNETGECSALRHCWGTSPIVTNTTVTLSDRRTAIPWDILSKTFKEAIIVTHTLGRRCIWIDSLCIIQDDIMDWEEESKKMGEVYGNSKVTLAAPKSEDGHGGCFIENDKIVHYRHPDSQTTIAVHNFNHHRGCSCFAGEYHTKDKPLFHRAGTLPEALFAPRVLYFGSKEIAFQCRRLLCCRCEGVVEVVTDTPKLGYEQARLQLFGTKSSS